MLITGLKTRYRKLETSSCVRAVKGDAAKGTVRKLPCKQSLRDVYGRALLWSRPCKFPFFMETLLEYQKLTCATIVLSTHNMKSVEELCSDVVLLNKGRIEISGNVNNVRKSFSKENSLILEVAGCNATSMEDIRKRLKGAFRIISSHLKQDVLHLELSRAAEASTQTDLLHTLKLLEGYDVVHISHKVLSMEDIFVQLSKK